MQDYWDTLSKYNNKKKLAEDAEKLEKKMQNQMRMKEELDRQLH